LTTGFPDTSITVCFDCDMILPRRKLLGRQVARCDRCDAVVYRSVPAMVDKTLGFSLAGLLFFIPANALPILTFAILGVDSTNTMFKGVEQLFEADYLWMALLVLVCSVLAPLSELILLFCIALFLKLGRGSVLVVRMILLYARIREWAMLEVYMLGILVAYIKMIDMGDVVVGTGLYCYVLMLVSAILASRSFDSELGFDVLDHRDYSNNGR
jgi:paraquat-inducible protein A